VTESGSDSDDDFEFTVDDQQAGGRLDAVIAAAIASLSRAQVQRLIEDGRVVLAGTVATKAGARDSEAIAAAITASSRQPAC